MSDYDKDILFSATLSGVALAVCMSGFGLVLFGVVRLMAPRIFDSEGEIS